MPLLEPCRDLRAVPSRIILGGMRKDPDTKSLKNAKNILLISNRLLKNIDKKSSSVIIPKKIYMKAKDFNAQRNIIGTQIKPYEEEKIIYPKNFDDIEKETQAFFAEIKNIIPLPNENIFLSNISITSSYFFFNDEVDLNVIYPRRDERTIYKNNNIKDIKEKLGLFIKITEKNIQDKKFTNILVKSEINIVLEENNKKIVKTPDKKEIEVINVSHSSITKEIKVYYSIEEVL